VLGAEGRAGAADGMKPGVNAIGGAARDSWSTRVAAGLVAVGGGAGGGAGALAHCWFWQMRPWRQLRAAGGGGVFVGCPGLRA
jgi:hypothetical protein